MISSPLKFLRFLIYFILAIGLLINYHLGKIDTFAQQNNEQKKATITRIYTDKCNSESTNDCQKASVIIDSNPDIEASLNLGTDVNFESYGSYSVGDLINVRESANGSYILVGPNRDTSFIVILIIFIIIVLLVGRVKGLRSLIALTLSTLIILIGIIPLFISYPSYILLIGSVGVFLIYILNQIIGHGFNKVSYISIVSAFFSFLLVGLFSVMAGIAFKITGFGDDNAVFVAQEVTEKLKLNINLGDIFIVGLLFGLAGAIDDVNVTQINTVKEFCEIKNDFEFKELYQKVMKIGTSHMVSIINTLFLAYLGAALPTIMLFGLISSPPFDLISRDDLTEEILRTLIASSGLIIAIPISSFIAISAYIKKPNKFMTLLNSILRTK
jgi:uncharacterized membrane protein